MKEKELRLAVVFFGGVSLAVYQHGINREILNLVRASRLYHGASPGEEDKPADFHRAYPDEPQRSTGQVYLQCLQAIGRNISLRVIVDVISGASAGGMNGIVLARALAHDLSLAPLTDMWLAEADMLKLLAPEARARQWNKWILWPFVRPMLARLHREGLIAGKVDEEMAERVSVFLRSRWFKPPLDGRRLAALVLDALTAMEKPQAGGESLLPPGTTLDLQVTATDYGGLDRSIFIHDPPVVKEREHRHILRFRLEHDKAGHLHSDFDLDNVPSLAFAARASASYPGAFPPAQVREMDDLLASRHRPWPARSRFLARNFSGYREQGRNPEEAVLLDGSILDNKPIMATLEAIRAHSAYREVDRRLVYIDPHSRMDRPPPDSGVPGFFSTLRGALSDLPRTAPTYNELASLSRYNKQVRRLKETIQHARAAGRQDAGANHARAHQRQFHRRRIAALAPDVHQPAGRHAPSSTMPTCARWCWRRWISSPSSSMAPAVSPGIPPRRTRSGKRSSYGPPASRYCCASLITYRMSARETADMPAFAKMIIDFGVVYKKRRLHFVLHEINDLYGSTAADACSADPEDLDLIKIRIHKLIDEMAVYDDAVFLSEQAVATCRKLFREELAGMEPERFVGLREAAISGLVRRLGIECDLGSRLDDADAVLASPLVLDLAPRCRSAILTGYLGYFYWDIIVRPVVSALSLEVGPVEEVLIDRISPDDALSLKPPEATRMLLGGTFAGFGGFLSRATRENDYLWGRLHAVDRLFDILAGTVAASASAAIDVHALKKAAFECVIEEEATRLTQIPDLVARIRAAIAAF